MKDVVYITGHKNPDSDSICSAIAYSDYKNSTGEMKAVPVRLGSLNKETKFILDYFDVEAPQLMETVRLSVEDLNFDTIPPVSPTISLRTALNLMNKNNVHSLPVVDDKERLIGIVTLSDIMQSYIDVWDNTVLSNSKATIENIVDTLSGKAIYIPDNVKNFDGKLLVLAMEPESLREYIETEDVVICGDRIDIQKEAIKHDISLMIITGDSNVDKTILKEAKRNNITIISTPHDTFTASRLITQSVSIEHVMTKNNLVYFSLDDLVDDVKVKMSETRYRSYPVVDHEQKVIGSISRYHLISSMKKKVILVDHNERSQSIDGLEEAEILEIIDHHRVADVFTGNPIYFRNEPVGSTCTIIGSIMFENGRIPTRQIAGILAAGIISDTLLLKSPTSTINDKIMLERLTKIADIDSNEFADEMFKAGTSLTGKTPKELLSQDFKSFTIKNKKVGIAQVYTMDFDSLNELRVELIETMEERAEEHGYDAFVLMLTNIFEQASDMIVVGEDKDHIASAFGNELSKNSFYAPDVVSRKKQVVPPITTYLSNIDSIL